MRHRFATTMIVGITAASSMAWGATPAASAHADRCVTKAEYRQVRPGMAKTRVHAIFGTPGYKLGLGLDEIRRYTTCENGGFVQVIYNGRGGVISKAGTWVSL